MSTLPPELAAFTYLLDAQPTPARDAFQYCLCLLMVRAGMMRLVEKIPSENGVVCVFQTTAWDKFSVTRPHISKEQEAALMDVLGEILRDEGVLKG